MPSRSAAVLALCLLSLGSVGAPTSGQSPSTGPTASALPALVLPAPPAGFDPGSVPWIGTPFDDSDQGWVGAVDGSDLVPLRVVSGDALVAADGSVVGLVRRPGGPIWRYRLVREVPGGPATVLMDDASGALVLSEDGRTAYVARRRRDARGAIVDRGYWRVPLDRSPPVQVLPASEQQRAVAVVSPDERAFVTAEVGDLAVFPPQGRFGRHPARHLAPMRPLGFDERNRLVGLRDDLVRVGQWSPKPHRIADEPDAWASVIPGGRWLLVGPADESSRLPYLVDLRSDSIRPLDLVPARWRPTTAGTSRYLVLAASIDGRRMHAIVDLEEGWIGYLPFEPTPRPAPAMSAACAADFAARPRPVPSLDPSTRPAPPAGFDPASIPFLGGIYADAGEGDPLWLASIDGSDLRCAAPAHGRGRLLPDGRVAYREDGTAGSQDLVAASPGGEPQLLLRDPSSVVATAADVPGSLWVVRGRSDAQEDWSQMGLWRVRLDGTRVRRLLPQDPKGRRDGALAVSADGRSVAMDNVVVYDTDTGYPLLARFDGGPVVRGRYLRPFGFDAKGRLIGLSADLQAYDPETGRRTPLAEQGEDGQSSRHGGTSSRLSRSPTSDSDP